MPGIGGVTDEAVAVELTCGVIRVGDVVVIAEMTGIAVCRVAAVLPAYVALFAVDRPMRAGQREGGCFMVEGRGLPSIRGVADKTIMVELTRNVIGSCDIVVIS